MIKVLTGNQMQNIDKIAINDLKIPSLILMENAGISVYKKICELLADFSNDTSSVLVICGKGNNGGDGFVTARHLIENNVNTFVVALYNESDLKGDVLVNYNILKNYTNIVSYDDLGSDELDKFLQKSTIVVDAILGTGLKGNVRDDVSNLINKINRTKAYIVAVDIASGLDSNTGKVLGVSVKADCTVTFLAPKLGSVIQPGAQYSGDVFVYDISIPKSLIEKNEFNINLISATYIKNNMPVRIQDSNKSTFGRVFNIAGSLGMSGAAAMASVSSLKAGAGYSTLAIPSKLVPIIASIYPDLITIPVNIFSDEIFTEDAADYILEKSVNTNCYVIGPGIGTEQATVKFVDKFLKLIANKDTCVVIDADALNCISLLQEFKLPKNTVITPHVKELSRLLGVDVLEIIDNKIKFAKLAAEKFNCVVVLKGSKTLIATQNGDVYINQTGCSAIAKAGAGDVLSGMIAGFASQTGCIFKSAILGVYLHGLAADIAAANVTEYSLLASELVDFIPQSIKKVLY